MVHTHTNTRYPHPRPVIHPLTFTLSHDPQTGGGVYTRTSAGARGIRLDISDKYDSLLRRLAEFDSVLVAYSGGVDSTLLTVAAHAVLGEKCLAVLANSDTYPDSEIERARHLAHELNLRLLEVETNELVDPAFRENSPDRCYHCKCELFALLARIAQVEGLAHVADGSNADDLADYRPGSRAAREYEVVSPLQEAGLTKVEVRELARSLGLPNWNKPSMACLASRFPYGEPITEERLFMVARAEDSLRDLGLQQFRLRAHGDVGRLEVDPSEMDHAWELRVPIAEAVRDAGFAYIAQDLEGYRSGSLNETL